jgi:hypothetical protein
VFGRGPACRASAEVPRQLPAQRFVQRLACARGASPAVACDGPRATVGRCRSGRRTARPKDRACRACRSLNASRLRPIPEGWGCLQRAALAKCSGHSGGEGVAGQRSERQKQAGAQPLVRADTLQRAAPASRRRSTRTLGASKREAVLCRGSACKANFVVRRR